MSYDVKLKDVQPIGQGPAKLADGDDIIRDKSGYSNPNLHRRILSDESKIDHNDLKQLDDQKEDKCRDYTLSIRGTDSYRTIEHFVHSEEFDEDSDNDEAP